MTSNKVQTAVITIAATLTILFNEQFKIQKKKNYIYF